MSKSLAVIGIGNLFRGDDAIGLVVIHELLEMYPSLKEMVDVIDGGTGAMNLYHLMTSYERVIIVDAVDFGANPGDFIVFSSDEMCASNKMPSTVSTHGDDVFTVLKNIEKYNASPPNILIFGIQPKRIELSDKVSNVLQQKISVYLDELYQLIHKQFDKER